MLNLGIIGYGGFGQFLHCAWKVLDQVNIIAVADLNRPETPDMGIQFYPNWKELLTNPSIDVVSIVTPPSTHAEIACAAMEARKHVLIEKPIATHRDDALRILAVRDRTKRAAGIGFMLRFHPLLSTVRTWCESKCFGTLRRVVVENYAQDESLPPSHWFWNKDISGGILVEHGVHFIDLVNHWADAKVKTVQGLSHERSPQQEDRVLATVLYEDGLVATHYHAFSRPGFFERTTLRAVFDLAEIELEGWIPLDGRIMVLVNSETEGEVARLPGLVITERTSVDEVQDLSRPNGWGLGQHRRLNVEGVVHSGGISYDVEDLLAGTFSMGKSKGEVYGDCLRDLLSDFVQAVTIPGHRSGVPLECGLEALEVALAASESARMAGEGAWHVPVRGEHGSGGGARSVRDGQSFRR
jgi:predicted dehydrogenase